MDPNQLALVELVTSTASSYDAKAAEGGPELAGANRELWAVIQELIPESDTAAAHAANMARVFIGGALVLHSNGTLEASKFTELGEQLKASPGAWTDLVLSFVQTQVLDSLDGDLFARSRVFRALGLIEMIRAGKIEIAVPFAALSPRHYVGLYRCVSKTCFPLIAANRENFAQLLRAYAGQPQLDLPTLDAWDTCKELLGLFLVEHAEALLAQPALVATVAQKTDTYQEALLTVQVWVQATTEASADPAERALLSEVAQWVQDALTSAGL